MKLRRFQKRIDQRDGFNYEDLLNDNYGLFTNEHI